MLDSQNMNLGFRVLDAQVVSLLSADFWLAKIFEHAPHVRGSMTI